MTKRFLLVACVTVCLAVTASVPGSASQGRWKAGDDGSCVFDPSDEGPDQCDPTPGRWKDDGSGGCYFDANDGGPDQCSPASAAQ